MDEMEENEYGKSLCVICEKEFDEKWIDQFFVEKWCPECVQIIPKERTTIGFTASGINKSK